MILYKKSVVVGEADMVPANEELPLTVPETKTEPFIVSHRLWLPYEHYEKMRDFIYSREDDILENIENFGALFSVLQWVNYVENELRSSARKVN